MANYNLAGQKIKNTYQQVAQVDGTTLVNGSGTATPIATSSIVNFPTEVSRSAAAAGFGSGVTATWPVSGTPSGLVSSSAQVNLASAYGSASNAVNALSSSHAELADYATSAGDASTANQAALVNITATSTNANYPVMFVSSNGYQSPRIDTETLGIYYNPSTNRLTTSLINGNTITATTAFVGNLTGNATSATSASYATNALSASYAPAASLPSGLVSSSAQISYTGITDVPSGIVSSSSQVSYSGITGVPSGIVSGAAQLPEIGTNTSNIASLTAATSSYLTSLPSGVVSSSAQVDLASAYGTAANATSASYAVSASYAPSTPTPAFPFTGSAGIQGNLDMNSGGAIIISDWTGSLANTSVLIGKTSNDPTLVNTGGVKNVQIGTNVRIVESSTRDNVVAIGADISCAQNAVTIGQDIQNNTDSGIAIGKGSRGYGNAGIAIGAGAQQYGSYSVSLGYGSIANSNDSIAIGRDAQDSDSNREGSIQIGYDTAAAQYGIGFGYNAEGNGDSAIGIGSGARGNANYTIAIGRQATSYQQNAIIIGDQLTASVQNEINIGGKLHYNIANQGEFKLDGAVRVPTQTLTITSNTASVDCGSSNFFDLNAAGGLVLLQNPTNVQDGASYTFRITNGTGVTFGSNYLFESGSTSTLTSGTDIVTFVSIGGTNLYGVRLLNFQ